MKAAKTVTTEDPRLSEVFDKLLGTLRNFIRENRITHEEYRRAVAFLAEVGQKGEVSLICDVFVEVTVDEVANNGRGGTITTIEGPFYVPNAPAMKSPCELPHRPDEKGPVLFLSGVVRSPNGDPLPELFSIYGNQISKDATRISIFLKQWRLTTYVREWQSIITGNLM